MIQRIQTLYLFIAFISMGILPFIFPLWKDQNGHFIYIIDIIDYSLPMGLSSILSIIGIMSYKNRKKQFVIGRLNIILNLILLGLLLYRSLNLSGEMIISEKGIGIFLPLVSIVFLVLANKAIKKDEDLVKSADRLR